MNRFPLGAVDAIQRRFFIPQGAVSVLKADEATEETGTDRPAAPFFSELIHSGSAPPIHDEHGFADEHAANAPLSGHGTVRDQRTPRAAIDGLPFSRIAATDQASSVVTAWPRTERASGGGFFSE